MSLELKESTTIGGTVVERIGGFHGNSVYSSVLGDDRAKIYIVDVEGKVVCQIDLEADCGQNFGYINDVTVREV